MVAYYDTAGLRNPQHTSFHVDRVPYAYFMSKRSPGTEGLQEPSAFTVAFGLRLKDARDAKKLTGEALGAQVGKTKNNVSHWENGHHMPDLETFAGLCDALDWSADDLLGRSRHSLSAAALEEARAFDRLPPEQQKKWRAMRLALFSTV